MIVSPDDFNLALGKPAGQSSDYWNSPATWGAQFAVDGNIQLFSNTYDKPGGPNWLMVDLGQVYSIGYVVVVNRVDCCRKIVNCYDSFQYDNFVNESTGSGQFLTEE